jgi:cytochrome c2
MISKSFISLLTLAIGLTLTVTHSMLAADIMDGRKLAEQWCAKCHNIEKGAPFKLHPPSFASIAAYRESGDIRGRIISPHIGMPDITWLLQSGDLDKLVIYITSLEGK